MTHRPVLALLQQRGVQKDVVDLAVHHRHFVIHPAGHVSGGLSDGAGGLARRFDVLGRSRQHQARAHLDGRQCEARHLLGGVADVGKHGRSAGPGAHHREEAHEPGRPSDRRFDLLLGSTIEPRLDHGRDGLGIDAGKGLPDLLGHHPLHVTHGHLHVREQQHLVDVLGQGAKVQRQGPVVFDTGLREALRRCRESVGHGGIVFLSQGAQVGILHHPGISHCWHIAAAILAPRRLHRLGGHLIEVAPENVPVRALGAGLCVFEQIPHALGKVKVRLGDLLFNDHAA